jgi:hypothetical protein
MSSPFNPGWAAQQAAQQAAFQASQAAQRASQQAAFQASQASQRAVQQANQQQMLLNGQLAARNAMRYSARRSTSRGNGAAGCLGALMLLVIAVAAVALLAHNPGIMSSIQHHLNATPTH